MSKLGKFLTRFILKTKSVTPEFFAISDIGNSLSDGSQSMKKICIVEVFRANVLKPLEHCQMQMERPEVAIILGLILIL